MPPLFHTFSIPKHWYVFDANTNSIITITQEQFQALSEIEHGNKSPESLAVLNKLQNKGFCCDVNIESIQHPDTNLIEAYLGRKIRQITLQVTQRCNLRCDYCTYSGRYENRTHSPRSMSFDTAKKGDNLLHILQVVNPLGKHLPKTHKEYKDGFCPSIFNIKFA